MPEQLQSAHAGHVDVREHRYLLILVITQVLKGFSAIFGKGKGEFLGSQFLTETLLEKGAYILFVIYY
jgi:hypothetical protein